MEPLGSEGTCPVVGPDGPVLDVARHILSPESAVGLVAYRGQEGDRNRACVVGSGDDAAVRAAEALSGDEAIELALTTDA